MKKSLKHNKKRSHKMVLIDLKNSTTVEILLYI